MEPAGQRSDSELLPRPVTTSRKELLELRRKEVYRLNNSRFAAEISPRRRVVLPVPFTLKEPRARPEHSAEETLAPKIGASREYLPDVLSARRLRKEATAKPFEQRNPRYLHSRLPLAVRPNSGTLNDGAPMYSSFTQDHIYRGDLPRGALELTQSLPRGGFFGPDPNTPRVLSRTLIR